MVDRIGRSVTSRRMTPHLKTADLHNEMVEALYRAGAVSPCPLFHPTYVGENADAVFVGEELIVEVKSIAEDHMASAKLEERLAADFRRWFREGEMVVFGDVNFGWDDYPEWLQHRIEAEMAPSVATQLRKANRQIRETQGALGWNASYGVCAFVVPNGFNVDLLCIGRIAWNQLIRREDHWPNIHAVVVVSVPVADQPATGRPPVFAVLTRTGEPAPFNLADRLGAAWMNHYASRSGAPVVALEATREGLGALMGPRISMKFDLDKEPPGPKDKAG